jgi:hypothetical protein
MRFNLIPPRHTAASVVRQLAEGLESGAIILRPEQPHPGPEAAGRETPPAGQPAAPAGDGRGAEG